MDVKLDMAVNGKFLAKVEVLSIQDFKAGSELVRNFIFHGEGLTLQ